MPEKVDIAALEARLPSLHLTARLEIAKRITQGQLADVSSSPMVSQMYHDASLLRLGNAGAPGVVITVDVQPELGEAVEVSEDTQATAISVEQAEALANRGKASGVPKREAAEQSPPKAKVPRKHSPASTATDPAWLSPAAELSDLGGTGLTVGATEVATASSSSGSRPSAQPKPPAYTDFRLQPKKGAKGSAQSGAKGSTKGKRSKAADKANARNQSIERRVPFPGTPAHAAQRVCAGCNRVAGKPPMAKQG